MSGEIFIKAFPERLDVQWLIQNDMLFHTAKSADLDLIKMDSRHWTLLLVSLCEIHANADLFGGIRSESFKIKQKRFCSTFKKLIKTISLK